MFEQKKQGLSVIEVARYSRDINPIEKTLEKCKTIGDRFRASSTLIFLEHNKRRSRDKRRNKTKL